MPDSLTKARLGEADPNKPQQMKAGSDFAVHFNPVSLQYTLKNTLKEGSGKSKQQHVSQTSAQLSLELIFDTTHSGEDVRVHTVKVVNLMKPDAKTKAPPTVQFEWGTFMFRGLIDSYKETIDFFAANGVPLRSTLSLTLASQDKVFDTSSASKDRGADVTTPGGPSLDPTKTAQLAGDPKAARSIASSNNQESLRFSKGPLTVEANVKLNGPTAFASGSAGLSAGGSGGIGGGIGVSGGAGIGVGGGISGGIGASAGASIGISGGVTGGTGVSVSSSSSASFGVSASEGAFANLRAQVDLPREITLDTSKLLPAPSLPGISTDSGATFSLGGQAKLEGSASLKADVGAKASLKGKIQFD
ncbi:MAG: hypothetical protein U0175_25620 [Caldilineaceae bacterium]